MDRRRRLPQCPLGCGADVRYIRMESGKRNPMDPDPSEEAGNVVVRRGVGKQLGAQEAAAARTEGYALYLSHFVSCPVYRAEEEAKRRRRQFTVVEGDGPAASGSADEAPPTQLVLA